MRKVMALCTGLLLLLTPVWGAEQARPRELSLELTTQSQAPMFVMPAGMNYPGMTDMNRPTRTLSGEAEYALPPSPPVQVAVPADLQLPLNLLALQLTRPETLVMPSGMGEVSGTTPTGRFQFTIRQYWHPDTYAGPLVENIDIDMNDMQRYRARGGYPGMTVVERAYDRTPSGSAEVTNPAVDGAGWYTLNTGNIPVWLDGFLQPVSVSQPAAFAQVDPARGFDVVWQPDREARGYILHLTGMIMEGQTMKGMTNWVSTLVEPPLRVRNGYEVGTTISADVAAGILLPPGTTRCRVPAGMFTGRETMLTLRVTAVGNDVDTTIAGTRVRATIRSEWTAMKMAQMGGMPGGPGMRGGQPGGVPPSGYHRPPAPDDDGPLPEEEEENPEGRMPAAVPSLPGGLGGWF